MATKERLEQALRNADKAGDVAAAKRFAAAIRNGEFDDSPAVSAAYPDVPSAAQDEIVAEGYRQRAAEAAARPRTTMADRAQALGETALTLGTGATTGTLGQIAGTIQQGGRELLSGQFGTPEAANRIEQRAADVAASATYSPRSALAGEYLGAISEAAAPLAGLAGLSGQINAAGQAARVGVPAVREMQIPQTRSSQDMAQRIVAGETSKDLARSMVTPESIARGAPRVASDSAAQEAIKQGFDEGIVQAIKQTTPVNKSKLLKMADIAEKSKNDSVFGATNRPADVAGDSLAQRIKTIRSVNKDAGQRLDTVAKSLKGQKGNLDAPTENFAKNLNEMGVTEGDGGALNFIGSDIEGIAGAEKILKQVASRVRKLDANDAYDMHRLKRYIDEQVTYGKSTEGLSGKAERTLKNLRADIDASLDEQFPEYNKVNTRYADTIGALDAFQDAAGTKVNLFGENSEKALGTVSRRLLSNTQSRVNLIDSIKNIDDVAKKYGTTFDDDIMTQVLFADELDKVFGAAARTSLQGDVGKGVKRGLETATGQRTLTGIGIDAASSAVEKFRGINEKNAFKSIKNLLAREAEK